METSSRSLFFWTKKGISVTTRYSFFSVDSCTTLPLIFTEPRPSLYASKIPLRPIIEPPVGKSGPGKTFMISANEVSELSINKFNASEISDKLCGAMFVAIPTAIPEEPFTKRPGKSPGRTEGSCKEPS